MDIQIKEVIAMKKLILSLLALCFAMIGCGAEETVDPLPVPETLVIADMALTDTATVEIYSGITGERQRFTDADTVGAVLEALHPIEGGDPISAYGIYATFYVLTLYDAEDVPILTLSLVKPNDHCYVGCGTYETINGFDYSALYEIAAAQFDAVDALCMSLMDEVPVYD